MVGYVGKTFKSLEKVAKVWARLAEVWFGLIRSGSK